MVHIPPNLPEALFFAGGVVHIVTVFINFNNHDVTSHIQEKVRPSPGAPIFYPLVALPGNIRKLFFKKSCNSVLLCLVVLCNRRIRKQIGKAIPTVPIIFGIFMGRTVWGFAQLSTITILAIPLFFHAYNNLHIPPHTQSLAGGQRRASSRHHWARRSCVAWRSLTTALLRGAVSSGPIAQSSAPRRCHRFATRSESGGNVSNGEPGASRIARRRSRGRARPSRR